LSRGVRERRIRRFHRDIDGLANEFQAGVPEERSGQEAALAKHLEPVADTHHQTAVSRKLLHGLHYRREAREGSAAKVISIGKSAGQNDGIDVAKPCGIVPNVFRFMSEIMRYGVQSVVITIAAGENDNSDFHGDISV